MKHLAFLVFFIYTFFGFSNTKTMTLNQVLNIVLDRNPSLTSLKNNLEAQKKQSIYTSRIKFGDLTMNGGFTTTSELSLVRPMTKDLLAAGVSAMPFDDQYMYFALNYHLPIYTGGKQTLSEHVEQDRIEISKLSIKEMENNLIYKAKEFFFRCISTEAELNVLNDYVKALNDIKHHISLGVDAGKYPELHLLKANYDLEGAMLNQNELIEHHTAFLNSLNELMGLDEGTELLLLNNKEAENVGHDSGNIELIIEKAKQNRSDYKQSKTLTELKKKEIDINKSEWKPKVSLNAGINTVNATNIDFSDDFWSVSLNVSIPIFNMGKKKLKIDKAIYEYKSAENQRISRANSISKEVKNALNNIRTMKQKIKTSEAAVKLQSEIARIETLKYKNGKGDIDDLLLSQVQLKQARTKLETSRYDLIISQENLNRVIEEK